MIDHKKLKLLLAAASIPLGGAHLAAQMVVDWGGDYVSGDQVLQAGGFSGGDPQVLSPGSGYSGVSSGFVGAATATDAGADFLIDDNGTADRIQFRLSSGDGNGLVLWNQFIGGDPGIAFDEASEIRMNTATLAGGNITRRLVLRDSNATYYASTSTIFGSDPVEVNPVDTSWFAFDPENDLVGVGSAVALDFSNTYFSEVGFLVNFTGTSAARAVRIDSFQVDALSVSAVPEPATTAVMFGALAGFGVLMRRRARRAETESTSH